jgi:redox-sensing transcriptional repressor
VGAGRLGTALANYTGFARSNFSVVAVFDNDREKIGRRIGPNEITVHDVKKIERIVREQEIDVAVIAVPARAAQKVLNQIMVTGISAVLNFAPAPLTARLGVKVKTVDLTTSLESLAYFLSRPAASAVTKNRRSEQHTESEAVIDKEI